MEPVKRRVVVKMSNQYRCLGIMKAVLKPRFFIFLIFGKTFSIEIDDNILNSHIFYEC